MTSDQIAIQFYTLRDHLKTPEDFAATCSKVAGIGYKAVQISGVSHEAVPPATIAAICADHGLKICATHEASDVILNTPQQVVETLHAMGTRYTAYPFPAGIDFGSEESVAGLIAHLSAAGRLLADNGMVLTYHNHHQEFRKLNGRLILDRIYEETSHVQGEIDTYWVQYGGGDPIAWCEKLSNRLPLLHLKDYRVNSDNGIEFCEVGFGNLNIPGIIAAAEKSGCKWFIVEQDTCPGDPFESIRMSFDYLNSLVSLPTTDDGAQHDRRVHP